MKSDETGRSGASLDELLKEIKKLPSSGTAPAEKKEAKQWSLDDIDRLIAAASSGGAPGAAAAGEKAPEKPVSEPVKTVKEPVKAKEEPVRIKEEPVKVKEEPVRIKEEPVKIKEEPVKTEGKTIIINSGANTEASDEGGCPAEEKKPAVSGKTMTFTPGGSRKSAVREPEEEHIPDYDPLGLYEKSLWEQRESSITTDENRKSFISPKKPAPVEEPPEENGPVERPGMLLEKGGDEDMSGLEPLPKLISADKVRDGDADMRIARGKAVRITDESPESDDGEFPGQIKLTGFEDLTGDIRPEKVDEDKVEEDLINRRRLRAKNFKLDTERVTDTDTADSGTDEPQKNPKKKFSLFGGKPADSANAAGSTGLKEYTAPGEKRRLHSELNARMRRYSRRITVCAATEIAMLLFTFLPSVLADAGVDGIFSPGGAGSYVVIAILLIISIASNSNIFTSGLSKLFSREPDAESAAALSAVVAFLHNTVAAVVNVENVKGSAVFSMAAVLGFAAVNAAGFLNCKRMRSNLELCAFKCEDGPFVIKCFDDEAEQREMSRGVLMDRAEMLYSAKTSFPSDFVKNSRNTAAEKKAAGILIPIAAAAAIITGVVALLLSEEHSAIDAFTVCAGTFCACSPVFAAFVPAAAMSAVSRTLNKEGSMLTGTDSAQKIGGVNGVVIDSADVFDRAKCSMPGFRNLNKVRMDVFLTYAAALVIKSGGPLKECFENVISNDYELLPEVRSLTYEDKLGISARISGLKVLLGNRALMLNHGVEVPANDFESQYAAEGCNVIFLAINGELSALFVVKYEVDLKLRDYFERFEEAGTKIIVRTNDVNVTEEMLAKGFNMPKTAFCVLDSYAGRIYNDRHNEVVEKCPVHLVHNGKGFTMVRAIAAVQQLCRDLDALLVLQIILSSLGFVGAAVLTGFSMTGLISGAAVTAFLAVCGALLAAAAYLLNGKD